jgi:serine protease AprX
MKKQMQIFLCVQILLSEVAVAQPSSLQHMWVFFSHKSAPHLQYVNPEQLGLSKRALKRRLKTLPSDRLIDECDLPVLETLVAQVKQTGIKIRTISRWLNAVSVEGTMQQLLAIQALTAVAGVEPVALLRRSPMMPVSKSPLQSFGKISGIADLDYGPSATQLTNMKVVDLHAIGINGSGVLICMLDDGFNNYRTHAAFRNIKIDSTYDFIHNISDVNKQPWENSGQGNHGAGTLSAIGGFENGQLIGAAYGASFLLAKTEMDSSGSVDYNSEEDTYVAALEWAERLGADITSSSLGYKDFLSTPTYSTSDMNGRTTKVARAAVVAARKGVLVVTAMGNDGYIGGRGNQSQRADTTLDSPADADSIISVGATTSDGELATFSGCGPTADGRIKPEVVAQGTGIYWADGSTIDGYQTGISGTSCSTPLVAGAAALILSAHPQLTNMQVRDALMKTTVQRKDGTAETAAYPNNYYGYGFLNAFSAALSAGPVFSNKLLIIRSNSYYQIYTWIKQNVSVRMNNVLLYFKRGSDANFKLAAFIPSTNDDEYTVTIPFNELDSTAIGYVTAQDQSGVTWRVPSNSSNDFFSLTPTPDSLFGIFPTPGELLVPTQYKLYQNYPNPFNSSTFIIVEVTEPTNVDLEVFNLLGQRVKQIFHGLVVTHATKQWDGTNNDGHQVASGVYFARLITPHAIRSIKMLYLK